MTNTFGEGPEGVGGETVFLVGLTVFDGLDGIAGNVEIQTAFVHGRNDEGGHETLDRRESDGGRGDGDRVTEIDYAGILGNRRIEEDGDDGALVDLAAEFRSDAEDLGLFGNYIILYNII